MSANKAPPISIAGTPIHVTLRDEHDDVVARMVGRLPTTLASYVHLPSEALRGDVTRISSLVVKAYTRWLADGSPPDEETLDAIARSAALRAEEGFPFDAVVAAYALGLEGIVDRLVQRAGPDDLADVIALHTRVLELIRATTAAVARGYLAEVRTTVGEDRTARRMLLAALLRDESDPVVPAGLSLAAHYLLLSVGIEPILTRRRTASTRRSSRTGCCAG